jgi:hypothetical protein
MSDELEFMIDEFAFHLAHRDQVQLAEAEHLIRQLITGARQEYRDVGAPFGDTAAGFLVWLDRANRLTASV